jgi:hypothetical protein
MADDDYELKSQHCAPIAKPLASEKLAKKLLKLCKKATKAKQVKRGVKEVVKAIRKKNKGCASLSMQVRVRVSAAARCTPRTVARHAGPSTLQMELPHPCSILVVICDGAGVQMFTNVLRALRPGIHSAAQIGCESV